jgi:hypothetical protein
MNGLMHRSKQHLYSITSSARVRSVGGTVRPSTLAVFRLTTSSNRVGCWTGSSPGLSPFKILVEPCVRTAIVELGAGRPARPDRANDLVAKLDHHATTEEHDVLQLGKWCN